MAYIMAYHADSTIPSTIKAWLGQFEMFSIYEILSEILGLWSSNLQTDVENKKSYSKQPGNDDYLIFT